MAEEREEINAEEEEKNTANINQIDMQNLVMDVSDEMPPTAPKRTFDAANIKDDTSLLSHSMIRSVTNTNDIK